MANLDSRYAVDDRPLAFVNHRKGSLISLAGPGTGKTYSFLQRIKSLISMGESQANEICYLTFIKEISKAFLSDYYEEFSRDQTSRPRVSTLHSFACRLIRNRGFSIGYDGPLYFASTADREAMASQVFLDDLFQLVQASGPQTIPQLRSLLQIVKKTWRDDIDPKTLSDPIPKILDSCLKLAKAYRLIDWDQAIPMAHDLFLDPRNRQAWLTELQHYLVDEYQDFNIAEQTFIASLASNVTSMVIVGDDNQSIFSSRGGSPSGMRGLFQSSSHDQVSLQKCRRCKSNILEAANSFLLWMCPTALPMLPYLVGGDIHCYRFKSAKAEIAFLVDYLNNKVAKLPASPSPKQGIVCLFPSRKALAFYYDNIHQNVPSYTGKVEPHPERRKLELLLELVCNPNQRFIERLILESFKAIKTRHKQEMVKLILQHDIAPSQAIDSLLSADGLSASAADAGRAFVELCLHLSSQDPRLVSGIIANQLNRKLEEVHPLIVSFLSEFGVLDQDDLISGVCDRLIPEYAAPVEDHRSVLFLTMHGSKGLTKETVVLPGLEDSWIPGDSIGAELEEKKRLFYVALTRATDNLLITYPHTRARGDPLNYSAQGSGKVSCFVSHARIRDVYHD